MGWLATAVTVGTSAYSIYSSYQSGKAQKRQLEKQAEATMLTALKRISDRTTKSIYDKWEVANTGGEAIISNYIVELKLLEILETKKILENHKLVIRQWSKIDYL